MLRKVVLTAIITLGACLPARAGDQPSPGPYKVECIEVTYGDTAPVERRLNELFQEGWFLKNGTNEGRAMAREEFCFYMERR